ncbi:hypothetical protein G4Y79_15325 [Phototrophicus methaneseepsis]|uniref:Uncharacterized protein n=1 Tax=Phototrophicus methaneseepsis TaxID=2710758 RepID=A0A7S8ID75_9CHLR|nr:hypothetical protein [Phototrophicus methaneseepsis]QPC81074.1 hypothetical protein G4Y79_15325 [Phototrophicus methaneseepsis]
MSGTNLIAPEESGVWRRADIFVLIDFDRDDDFSDAYEDVTDYLFQVDWHIGAHQPYQLMADETELTMMLDNSDRRFSPENPDGPYYGQLDSYLKVKVEIRYEGTVYPMYLGYIDSIKPEPGDRIDCTIRCVGAKQQLQDQNIAVPLLTNVRSDQAIKVILEKLVLPPAMNSDAWFLGVPGSCELGIGTYLGDSTVAMSLETGLVSFPYVADNWDVDFHGNQYVGEDWSSGFKGWDAIADIVKAERGRFLFDREGKAVFWNRAHTQTQYISFGGFGTDAIYDYVPSPTIDLSGYSWGDDIANEIEVTSYPRSIEGGPSIIYELDEPVSVRAGQTRTITAKFTPDDTEDQISAINPYIQALTYRGRLTFGIEWLADKAKVTITNVAQTGQWASGGNATTTGWQSSSSAVYPSSDDFDLDGELTSLVLMGTKLTAFEEVTASVEDGVSRSLYGPRQYRIDAKLLNDPNDAHAIAEYELAKRKDSYGAWKTVKMKPINAKSIERVLFAVLGRKYQLTDETNGHQRDYMLVGEKHSWNRRSGVETELYFELLDKQLGWMLGTVYGELGVGTRLGY